MHILEKKTGMENNDVSIHMKKLRKLNTIRLHHNGNKNLMK